VYLLMKQLLVLFSLTFFFIVHHLTHIAANKKGKFEELAEQIYYLMPEFQFQFEWSSNYQANNFPIKRAIVRDITFR